MFAEMSTVAATNGYGITNIQIGAVAADQVERLMFRGTSPGAGGIAVMGRTKRRTITPAGTVVKLVYLADGTNATTFSDRRLTATPLRLG
jgi:hypothetical protein